MKEILDIKCPNCNGVLELGECFDAENWNDEYREYNFCYCRSCRKGYTVDVIYKFSHFVLRDEIEDFFEEGF